MALTLLAGCGSSSSGPQATPSAGAYVRHDDRVAGFSIVYPADWHYYKPADPGIQLRVGPDDDTSASVRVIAFPAPGDSAARLEVVNKLLSTVVVVDETATVVNGVDGVQVAYPVAGSANMEVHIHVFLFAPTTLHTIVFQTPSASLKKYAHTFDLMRDSYKVLAPPASPSPTPGATPAR